MKKITYILIFFVAVASFNSCNERDILGTSDINYINFENDTYLFGVVQESQNTREIKVYTTQISGSDRTYTLNVVATGTSADAAAYTIPASVTVPAGSNVGTFEVTVADVNIDPENGENLEIEIVPATGLFIGNTITLEIYRICPNNEVILTIQLDDWPEETAWALYEGSGTGGTMLYSGGPYDGQPNTLFRQAFCLEDGTYTLRVIDAYADGNGGTTLVYNGTTLLNLAGEFEDEIFTFTVPTP